MPAQSCNKFSRFQASPSSFPSAVANNRVIWLQTHLREIVDSWLFQLSIIFPSPPNCIFIFSSLAIHINFSFFALQFQLFVYLVVLCSRCKPLLLNSDQFCWCCCAIWISCDVNLLKIAFLLSNEFISTTIENSKRQITKCCNNELVIGLETYPNEGATNNFFLLLKVKLFRKTTDELTWWLWLKEKLKCIENEWLNLPIEKE